ncbi:hypothetical protein IWW55_005476 [Coemansia sp. RSA 2706]|nr:hypothetical protein IWW55_005476 [Coemansia sp. RSA 2706]KAJ2308873.1 hypothetical protein IWW52_005826 [Coemansia sp. RSA 2704]KAJ2370771.1 hypothetical protein H4S01_000150 [Coemansia sp. RSA 2610]
MANRSNRNEAESETQVASTARTSPAAETEQRETPLPWAQLSALLAVRLAEPVNLNLCTPFLYEMVKSFDIVKQPEDVPFYAGLLLTSYSFCQTMVAMYWGVLSDRIGRRPTLLIGLAGDLVTFVLFGLSKSFTWALVTRSLNGMFTGNSGVAKTVLVEIADDTNRPRMMALLPLLWNVGVIAGAALGGLLANPVTQYPNIFGSWEIFRIYPYLLPCLVGSFTTATGLLIGLFKLKETLVVQPPASAEETQSATATESTPLIAGSNVRPPHKQSIMSLLTPMRKRVLLTNVVMWLALAMYTTMYPMFAASPTRDGGLGFSTRGIGISLAITSIVVPYIQLVVYPAMVRKYTTLKCCQTGLKVLIPVFFAIPFLSVLAAHIERILSESQFATLPVPNTWLSHAGLEYGALWALLLTLLLMRTIGDIMAFTSINLIVSNVAPSAATLGTINGIQQMATSWMRIIGPIGAGALWTWSVKHKLFYPFNSHLVWVILALLSTVAWRLSLTLPESVNIYQPGQAARAASDRSDDESESDQ